MPFDLLFFAVAIPAVIFSGVSKGGFGGGASFASLPLLALVVDPVTALGLLLPLLMLIDVAALRAYWGKWNWQESLRLIAGSLVGLALGAWLLDVANPDVFRLLIGGISLAFVVWQIAQRAGRIPIRDRPYPAAAGAASGVVVGFTSFVSHAGGPALFVYLLAQRLDKLTFQATTVLVFWVLNILKFIPFAMMGVFSRDVFIADLILAPFAILGTWLGVVAHRMVSERTFFIITYILLTLAGSKLIWDALA